ncbi:MULTISPECIES: Cu(I)-responsive transcriptional regulator [Brevundimonas]|jgi:MerR family gold-responsive transcriptional activator of gol and ges genes|uniref:Cu(I)-responsive transcriptional regulator n=1 Tax=Brevundimonas balnearis TaxID=1572858 RepID=A0ABV6R6J1_9CAUL|nr:Cu(I)-responsive transcriptional regulator [Brevundimonas sp.]MBX3477259.1 Cu(I)-responsive transcriptional regulator [Brevundimonas sp.]
MNIGQASKATGVSTKMIRYYESVGLIRPADRTESNYRDFSDRDVNELRFIRRARNLGFSVEEITHLLSLWRDRDRSSREVKAIADKHVADLDARIAEMTSMADTLRDLARCCAGDDRPDCPILTDLSASGAAPASATVKTSRRSPKHALAAS